MSIHAVSIIEKTDKPDRFKVEVTSCKGRSRRYVMGVGGAQEERENPHYLARALSRRFSVPVDVSCAVTGGAKVTWSM